jgi:hypothetical protein
MKAWTGNFDFEHQLASGLSYQRSNHLARINRELAPHLIPLANDGDVVVVDEPFPIDFLHQLQDEGFPQIECVDPAELSRDLQWQPWGWSEALIKEFSGSNSEFDRSSTPSLAAVQQVNSRAFLFEFEQQHQPLNLACEIQSLDDLRAAVSDVMNQSIARQDSPLRWVVKANFSMTGRECMRGTSATIDEPTKGWVQRRLKDGQRLFFEPWLERLDEFSVHWDIPASAVDAPQLVGICKLLCDSKGRFLGNKILDVSNHSESDEISNAIESARRLAEAIQTAGYWGPVGLDGMLYQSEESLSGMACRVTQDVNARWSMGRVAIQAAQAIGESRATLMHYPTSWLMKQSPSLESLNVAQAIQAHWPQPILRAFRTTPLANTSAETFQTSVLVVD